MSYPVKCSVGPRMGALLMAAMVVILTSQLWLFSTPAVTIQQWSADHWWSVMSKRFATAVIHHVGCRAWPQGKLWNLLSCGYLPKPQSPR